MTEKAEFEVELIDNVSPGARKAAGALDRAQASFRKYQSSFTRMGQSFSSAWTRARESLVRLGAAGGVLGIIRQRGQLAFIGLAAKAAMFSESMKAAFRSSAPGRFFGAVSERAKAFGATMSAASARVRSGLATMGRAGDVAMGAMFGNKWRQGLSRAGSAVSSFAARARGRLGDLAGFIGPKLGGAFSSLGGAIKKVPVQEFASKLKNGLLVAAAVAATVAAGITAMTVKMADFGQRSRQAFTMLTGSQEKGNATFEESIRLAKHFGMDLQTTAAAYQKALAAGFTTKQSEAMVKMAADMKALGVETQKIDSALDAMAKIKSTGTLQGDELMMLAEANVPLGRIYENLGAALGKTTEEIIKMKEAGEIKSGDALNAIGLTMLQLTGKNEFGVAGREAATQTLSGMAGILKAGTQDLFRRVGERAGPAFASTMGAISKSLESVLGNASLESGMLTMVTSVADGIKTAIPYVEAFMGALIGGFQEAWPQISLALGMLFNGFSEFGGGPMDTLKDFAVLLGKVTAFAVGLAAVFGGMVVAGIQLATVAVNGILASWDWLIASIGKVAFAIDDFILNLGAKWERLKTDAYNAALSLINGLVNGITAGAQWVLDAVRNLGSQVMGGLKSVLGIASPSKEFAYLGQMSAAGFSEGLMGSMRAANDNAARFGASALQGLAGAAPEPAAPVAVPSPEGAVANGVSRAAAGGGGRPIVIQVTTPVVAGNTPPEQAAKAGRTYGESAGQSIGEALEDIMLETGT